MTRWYRSPAAYVLGLVGFVVTAMLFVVGIDPERPAAALKPEAAQGIPPGATGGWIDDPAAVKAVVEGLPHPRFAQAAPGLVQDADEGKDALLYEACVKVTGSNLKAHNQNPAPCCVGEGSSSAIEVAQCVDIALGKHQEYKPISHSFIYGTSRIDIGGGQIRGGGSVGAWAAKAITTIGVVTCDEAGETNDGPGFAVEWGDRGVPAALKEKAAKHKVGTASLVTTARDILAGLQNGYPTFVCSDQGFTTTRDADGFCRPQGSWAHCMCVVGYRADRKAFCILQSWGKSNPKGPTAKGQPDCSFWIEWPVMDRMASKRDSFAVSNFDGYPARNIDWLVQRPARNIDWLALRFNLNPARHDYSRLDHLHDRSDRYAFSQN